MDTVECQSLPSVVPAERFINESRIHCKRSDTSKLLKRSGKKSVAETFKHGFILEDPKVAWFVPLSEFVRSQDLLPLALHALALRITGPYFSERVQCYLRGVAVLFEQITRTT